MKSWKALIFPWALILAGAAPVVYLAVLLALQLATGIQIGPWALLALAGVLLVVYGVLRLRRQRIAIRAYLQQSEERRRRAQDYQRTEGAVVMIDGRREPFIADFRG